MSDRQPRPWLCPEPRCLPLLNLRDGDYADITVPEPGFGFVCWGRMPEPVSFTYDGVEHPNDLNSCHYTPLKGLIRWQENEADWNVLASYYRMAGDLVRESKAADPDHRPECTCNPCLHRRHALAAADTATQGATPTPSRHRGSRPMTTDPAAGAMPGRSDVTDSAPRIEASDGVLDAVAQIVHFGQCFCGEWPCTEAADGAYLADAQGFVNMLGADGYRIEAEAAASGPVSAEALAEAVGKVLWIHITPSQSEAILARLAAPAVQDNDTEGELE